MSSSTTKRAGKRRNPAAAIEPGVSAGSRTIDGESRRLIREALLTNILVEAGAGSGKTQMLAERMAAGVATGVYQIEHMAAVTFTRKAASELRGRLHLALERKLRDVDGRTVSESGTPASATAREIAERLNSALGSLERFFAGTIHSFRARLLRERPVESGVSPGFTELDEVQDLEVRQRAWRDFVTSTRTAGDPDMMALLAADVRPNDLDGAFGTICANDDVEFPPGDAGRPDPTRALKALETFWNELQKHLPAVIDPNTKCPIQNAAREYRGRHDVSRLRLSSPSVIASLLSVWQCESKITQYRWADSAAEKKRLRDLINPLHETFRADTVDPYVSQWRQYVYRLSVTLLTRAREYAARERRRVNSLNYGDLLNLTARVLRENADVRHALQQKYRHLFVDEFQDTDPVQAEIVFLLSAAEVSPGVPDPGSIPSADWRGVPLRPGALFVVGDPKQSIYRFRRADIDTYNIVRSRFSDPLGAEQARSSDTGTVRKTDPDRRPAVSSVGRVLPLTMNFRSVPELCDWANHVFQTRFPTDPTTHSPRFAALDAADRDSNDREVLSPVRGVFTMTHACGRSDVLEENAARIAAYIRAEVDAKRRTFSDFLILTRRKRDRIAPYARALEAVNIPIEVSGAGAFGESAEVKALTVLLRALADPQDALSLIAVLRGPLFGVSDRELFAYKQSGGWFSVFASANDADAASSTRASGDVPPEPDLDIEAHSSGPGGRVCEAIAALRQFYRWTRVLPAAAAVDRILEHTGYLALAATTPGGVDAGDVMHAVDRVRQVVEEGGSLADAADSLEADREDTSEVESLPLEPGRSDVVRLMNLHKAKGLEADVVFLADPTGGFSPRVDVHIERRDLKAQGWFLVTRKLANRGSMLLGEHADWKMHKNAELPYLKAEEDRLLYVAATRARELLVVSRWNQPQEAPAWGALNSFLSSAPELPTAPSWAPAPQPALDCSLTARADANVTRVLAHDRVREHSWSIKAVTADTRHISRMTHTAAASADDPTKVVIADTPAHRADAGMAWGTLIHGLLEHAMRHHSANRDDLRRLAAWLIVDEPQLRTVIEEALDTVERVARADFWHLARSHEQSVESPFMISEARRLTNGVIDLMFQSDKGWQIVDYKTDLTLDPQSYEAQLRAYRAALRGVGSAVADANVVSVRSE